jgi:hypothetical protein
VRPALSLAEGWLATAFTALTHNSKSNQQTAYIPPAADGGRYKGKKGHLKVAATSECGAGGDFADFGVFDDAAAEFFRGGLQHGAT